MTYGGFQRLSEASAYSKRKREQLESESQESKDALDECKEAFNKKDTENKKETIELSQALYSCNDLRDSHED